jgi:cytochrome c-type biogenesis protein CcmH/NrfG
MDFAVWLPGIVAALAGVVGAAWLIGLLARRAEDDVHSETAIVDLEERAAHAIAQLRDLFEQQARLEPAMYAAEKERLEKVAADALRQRDKQIAHAKPTRRMSTPPAGMPAQWKGFLWGVATVAGIGGLVLSVQSNSQPRADGATMTGNSGGQEAPMQRPNFEVDAEMQALAERLQKDEKDVEALVRLAHKLLQGQALSEAHMLNERALSFAPDNVEALVHKAVLRNAMGDSENALRELDALLAKNPTMAEGWFFRGMIGMSTGKPELAKESWQKFVAVAPDGPQKERIRGFLDGKGLQMPQR